MNFIRQAESLKTFQTILKPERQRDELPGSASIYLYVNPTPYQEGTHTGEAY
jgi:hypothetical protein